MAGLGKVYLVGAGPGDPGLLTLKASRVLARADVVLYDHLVHPNILLHCAANAKLISVGKQHGQHSKQQTEINHLMRDYARTHRCIVRLKGGDPCVFDS